MILTEQQRSFIETNAYPLFLHAPAGCGKTTTLYEKIKHFLRQKPDAKVLIVVFNVLIKDQLKEKFKEHKTVNITTLHSFLYSVFKQKHGPVLLTSKKLKEEFKDKDKFNEYKKKLLNQKPPVFNHVLFEVDAMYNPSAYISALLNYDLIIVDEVQDLNQRHLSIFSTLLNHGFKNLILAGDLYQTIYSFQGASVEDLKRFLLIHNFTRKDLSTSFRYGQNLADILSAIIGQTIISQSGQNSSVFGVSYISKKQFVQSIAYLLYHAFIKDMNLTAPKLQNEYENQLFKEFVTLQHTNSTLSILVRNRNEIGLLTQTLRKNDVPFLDLTQLNLKAQKTVEKLEEYILGNNKALDEIPEPFREINNEITRYSHDALLEVLPMLVEKIKNIKNKVAVSSSVPIKVATIHSVKGLEFDGVIMPFVNNNSIPAIYGDPEEEKRVFYVALSRAKKMVILGFSEKTPSPFIEPIKPYLTIFKLTPAKRPVQMSLFQRF